MKYGTNIDVLVHAQSNISRFIFVREAMQQISCHRFISVEADVVLLSTLQDVATRKRFGSNETDMSR